MYQVLYRKWRPSVFADTVGQRHIAKTLLYQLNNNCLAHAYLFTGSRGTGKTSFAKILARAANCEHPVGGEPCNVCPTCLGILSASIPDVAEIDAASHSGVDNIRALRDEVAYTPVAARYRVYIIDEVHMLSSGAFNALLKTLEEPPPHALFILATTETHKIPVTISSRCQRFAFRRISDADTAAYLARVCQHERLEIEPAALDLLSHIADGSLRDALSLLDQCVSVGSSIGEALVRDTLGLAVLDDLAAWLLDLDNLSFSINRLNDLYRSGLDFSSILGQLSSLLRDLLMSQLLGDPALTRLSSETASSLLHKWPIARIMQAVSHIQESINMLSKSTDKRLEAEMCLVRLASLSGEQTADLSLAAQIAPTHPAPAPSPVPAEKPVPASVSAALKQAGEKSNMIPVIENSPLVAESEPELLSSEPRSDAKRDKRWTTFLTSLDPLQQNAVNQSSAELDGERLFLKTNDPFSMGVLQNAEFQKKVTATFPDGLVLNAEKKQVYSPVSKSLDTFLQEQNDLIIDE